MNPHIKLLIIAIYIFFSQGLSAQTGLSTSSKQVCFEIYWESPSMGEGVPNGRQKENGQQFAFINGQIPVTFYHNSSKPSAIDPTGHYYYSYSTGCVSPTQFNIGSNNIGVSFRIGENQPILAGQLAIIAKMTLPNGTENLIGKEIYQADANRRIWSFSKMISVSMSDIAPELVARANEIKKSVSQLSGDVEQKQIVIDYELKDLTQIIEDTEKKNFYDLTESDLVAYQGALERYRFIRSGISAKQLMIEEKTSELKSSIALIKNQIEAAVASEGLDFSAADLMRVGIESSVQIFESIKLNDLPKLNYSYDIWAAETVQQLKFLLDAGQRANFLEQALRWMLQSERFLKIIESKSEVSREELVAYETASKKVTDYLFGQGNELGVITTDFWFQNLNIEPSIRDAIDTDLAQISPEKAKELKGHLNALKAVSESLIGNLKALSELARAYKELNEANERAFVDKLIDGAIAGVKAAPEVGACVAKNVAAGSFADYYEFYYEKDFCTGESNSELDRFIAGASLTIAAGSAVLATPVGGWVSAQLDTPIKVVMKVGTAVKKATLGKAAADLERIRQVLAGGITYKIISRTEDAKNAAKGAFYLGVEMEQKILYGSLKDYKKFIGAHSPRILENSAYSVTDVVKNVDGTQSLRLSIKRPDGKILNKLSTLFPEHWTDEQILAAVRDVAATPAIGVRENVASLHRKIVSGVEIVVIREGEKVTSGYPTGTVGGWVSNFIQN